MASLLEVLLTFAATMLVFAFAAQSLQDVTKFTFALKSRTRLTAMRRLIRESAVAAGLGEPDGDEIAQQVATRLSKLSQRGVREKYVRLDVLEKQQLMDLVRAADPQQVTALRPLVREVGLRRLGDVACEIEKWFALSLDPVTERYRRRMRLGALASAAAVVLAVNGNAFDILQRASRDPAFRQAIAVQAGRLQAADSVARLLMDSGAMRARDTTATDSVQARLVARRDSAVAKRDSLAGLAAIGGEVGFADYTGWRFTFRWLLGIVVSILLVSLGAPFWHDVLESVLGLKNRIRNPRSARQEEAPANP